jgi:hypothetical protein
MISAPRSHNTAKTTGPGSSKNLSYARPIAEDAVALRGTRGRSSFHGGGCAPCFRLAGGSGRSSFVATCFSPEARENPNTLFANKGNKEGRSSNSGPPCLVDVRSDSYGTLAKNTREKSPISIWSDNTSSSYSESVTSS